MAQHWKFNSPLFFGQRSFQRPLWRHEHYNSFHMKLAFWSDYWVIIPFDSKHTQLRNVISYLSKELVFLR